MMVSARLTQAGEGRADPPAPGRRGSADPARRGRGAAGPHAAALGRQLPHRPDRQRAAAAGAQRPRPAPAARGPGRGDRGAGAAPAAPDHRLRAPDRRPRPRPRPARPQLLHRPLRRGRDRPGVAEPRARRGRGLPQPVRAGPPVYRGPSQRAVAGRPHPARPSDPGRQAAAGPAVAHYRPGRLLRAVGADAAASSALQVAHATAVEGYLPVPGATVVRAGRSQPWLVVAAGVDRVVLADLPGRWCTSRAALCCRTRWIPARCPSAPWIKPEA